MIQAEVISFTLLSILDQNLAKHVILTVHMLWKYVESRECILGFLSLYFELQEDVHVVCNLVKTKVFWLSVK